MNIWKDANVPSNDVGGLHRAKDQDVVHSFEADMKRWSVLVNKAKDDHGAHISDVTIMIAVVALVAAIGWFVFGDAVGGFLRRI